MLEYLRIRDLALIDDMELELHRNTLDIHDLKLEMRYRAWETAEMAKDECIVTLPGAGPVTVPPAQFNIFYVFFFMSFSAPFLILPLMIDSLRSTENSEYQRIDGEVIHETIDISK